MVDFPLRPLWSQNCFPTNHYLMHEVSLSLTMDAFHFYLCVIFGEIPSLLGIQISFKILCQKFGCRKMNALILISCLLMGKLVLVLQG